MSDFWEPWQPKVGDRVRVRVSSECQQHPHSIDVDTRDGVDGLTGTVMDTGRSRRPGHPYFVVLDRPVPCRFNMSGFVHGAVCAAVELDPLEPVQ